MPSLESFAESLPGGDSKIGGKSIYLYGIVIAVVVVVYLWWQGRGTNPVADNTAADSFDLPNVSGDLGDLPKSSGVGNDQTDNSTNTNAAWEITTVGWLITRGVGGLKAQTALEKYLGGEVLDYNESQIVNMAIEHNGLPPEGLLNRPQGTDTPPTTPSTGTELVKATDHHWTAKRQTWRTIGRIPVYKSPNAVASEVKRTSANNGPVTTVQYSVIKGQTWVRTSAGSYYLQASLVPAKLKK